MQPASKNKEEHFHFKGIKISNIDSANLRELVDTMVRAKRHGYFCLTDVGNIMMAQKDQQLANAINQATLSIADGMPLAWFGKLTGRKRIQRISGVSLFQLLVHHSDYRHFLLGDTEDTQDRVIQKVKEIKPDVRMNGFSPPFKARFSKEDNRRILEVIQKERPDIIWVSFGGGKQEVWMRQHAAHLGQGILIGVGAAFRYYIGDLAIPPQIIQKLGLQWVTRLQKNPKRWMTQGQFKFKAMFSLYFPLELIKTNASSHRSRGRDRKARR